MFLWLIKQIFAVKNALAGRRHPHQLAWGLAFGVLLGIIPHGNLLAIGLVVMVLCLNLNHAMTGLAGLAISFFAVKLDPYSHQLGEYVLHHPQMVAPLAQAWQLPFVPWTDLNNTVVMGSLLLGIVALIPVYVLSYFGFSLTVPAVTETPDPTSAEISKNVPAPLAIGKKRDATQTRSEAPVPPSTVPVGMETRIDVIRVADRGAGGQPSGTEKGSQNGRRIDGAHMQVTSPASDADNAQINQALNYLLRRLRQAQQEKTS
ncbi:hypothetical protein FF011L_39970 [Roseimaritima multifibrata]|uniref:DUF2062 domain-containing protein n=1 Tax=Roseimaritima multifibrata TaxID=1930274 RepID=A0A517MK09_9BACT|nr:hypothetical protein FF011L_39970 [Roseimaritima multifibrata]